MAGEEELVLLPDNEAPAPEREKDAWLCSTDRVATPMHMVRGGVVCGGKGGHTHAHGVGRGGVWGKEGGTHMHMERGGVVCEGGGGHTHAHGAGRGCVWGKGGAHPCTWCGRAALACSPVCPISFVCHSPPLPASTYPSLPATSCLLLPTSLAGPAGGGQ